MKTTSGIAFAILEYGGIQAGALAFRK